MMTTTAAPDRRAHCLTGKGQAVAILHNLQAAWDSLTPAQRTHAAELLAELKAVYRPHRALLAAP
jgi:hypothetical protein